MCGQHISEFCFALLDTVQTKQINQKVRFSYQKLYYATMAWPVLSKGGMNQMCHASAHLR